MRLWRIVAQNWSLRHGSKRHTGDGILEDISKIKVKHADRPYQLSRVMR